MAIWPISLTSRPHNPAATQRQRGIRVARAYPSLVLWSRPRDPSRRKVALDGARPGARQGGCQTRRLSIGKRTCGRATVRASASGFGGRDAGPALGGLCLQGSRIIALLEGTGRAMMESRKRGPSVSGRNMLAAPASSWVGPGAALSRILLHAEVRLPTMRLPIRKRKGRLCWPDSTA